MTAPNEPRGFSPRGASILVERFDLPTTYRLDVASLKRSAVNDPSIPAT